MSAVSNYPFAKAVTVGDSEFPKGRWLGFNGAAYSLDLDAAAEQQKVIGSIAHGVRAKNPNAAQIAADPSGRRVNPDRNIGLVVIPGTKVTMQTGGEFNEGDALTSDGQGRVIAMRKAGGGRRRLAVALEASDGADKYVTVFQL